MRPPDVRVVRDLVDPALDGAALVSPDTGQVLSYRELAAAIDHLAERLTSLGVRRHDRVALALPAGPEFVELLLAIGALGASAAPLNPAYGTHEFSFFLSDLQPRAILLPEGSLAAARETAPSTSLVIDVAASNSSSPPRLFGEATSGAFAAETVDADDVAILLHTSGTTNRPKQVPLRHRNVVASARSIAQHYDLTASDVSYCAMPLFHVHGLIASTLAQLYVGGTVIVPSRVGPARFWSGLADYGVTWYSASPTLHRMFLDRAPTTKPDSAQLRFARSCSSALSTDLAKAAEEYLEAPMLEAYGMTEASHEMTANPLPPGERRFGSVGVGTGAEVRVVNTSGVDVAEGLIGEVVVRGHGVMDGYVGNSEATSAAFFGEWFRTGDLGQLNGGYLTLVGRIKEIIIRGGENISPLEVESVLLEHRQVIEAVVYGIPDDKYGQIVGAAVRVNGDATTAALASLCKERLAAFKTPEVIHIVDELPRTATGKIQRTRMADHFGEG